MARWTGKPEIGKVLAGAEAWRDRCLLATGSVFSDRQLWTVENLREILERVEKNPIKGSSRDFLDKLKEQLTGASSSVIQLAAEVIWFLFLFPSPNSMKAETKRTAVRQVWSWSGESLAQEKFLDDETLAGVGHPGTAYLTHRPSEFLYVLNVVVAFKQLAPNEARRLLLDNSPWDFGAWLDQQEGSDRRLARNVFLYFLFPDQIERNTSRQHREQIYESFKNKLPADKRIRGRNRTLLDYDRAINEIRKVIEAEKGTTEFDFYQDDTVDLWFTGLREGKRKDFTSWLDTFLIDRGLRLNQSGRDTTMEKLESSNAISSETGFWSDDSGLTAKPPRWLIHLDVTSPKLSASVPERKRARAIGFANTKGGDSGALAVRVLTLAKTAGNSYQPIDTWEWLLLFCFPGGLKPGSAAQTFDDFDADTGALTYMNEKVPYIFSAMFCLNEPEDTFTVQVGGKSRTITYREATEALTRLIHVENVGGQDG